MIFQILFNFRQQAAALEQTPALEEPEELIDQQKELRDYCDQKRRISKLYESLQKCNKRVDGREQTKETCEQELFDYVEALDQCVAKMLFSQLT